MKIGQVIAKGGKRNSHTTRYLGDPTCMHEACNARSLRGRKYCFDHQLEYEADLGDDPVECSLEGHECTVYFIGLDGNDSVVKIGRTSKSIVDRISSLQTAHYETLVLLAAMQMPAQAEKWVHHALKDCRIRGEWFRRTDKVNRIIESAKTGDWDHFFQSFA